MRRTRAIEPAGKGKRIVVTVTGTTGKPSAKGCLPVGKHVFALQGDKVVVLAARETGLR